jgi:hypothetical protein
MFFICFKFIVTFKCFLLQVQIAGVGVHEGGQGQATAIDVWRRRRPYGRGVGRRHRVRSAVVEEAGVSLSSSVGSGSKAAGGLQIQADGAE